MTDEEKKIIKTMLEMGYDRTNIPKSDVDKVIYKGLRTLDKNARLKEAVGKIMEEIKNNIHHFSPEARSSMEHAQDCINEAKNRGLEKALEIINKHTEGLV